MLQAEDIFAHGVDRLHILGQMVVDLRSIAYDLPHRVIRRSRDKFIDKPANQLLTSYEREIESMTSY